MAEWLKPVVDAVIFIADATNLHTKSVDMLAKDVIAKGNPLTPL